MDYGKDISLRLALVYFGILIFGILILYRIFHIQFYEEAELKQKAQEQEIREFKLPAAMGSILSDREELLATSIPVFDVHMDVANSNVSNRLFREKVDSLSLQLALLFNKSKSYYKNLLITARRKGKRYLRLANNVTYDQLKKLRTFPILRRGKIKGGLIAQRKNIRIHPYGSLAGRTIGYSSDVKKVYVGIEGAYRKQLKGKDGKELRRRINQGDWVPVLDDDDVEPQDGYDVQTTINVNLQDIAEEALKKQLIEHDANMGCAVLMEVKTGNIKAIANLKKDKKGQFSEVYNMAIHEKIEPGSTFKLPSLMAAMEDKKITLNDTVDASKGYVIFYHRTLRDVHPVGNGPITVKEVFAHSSNVGVSKLIWRSYKDNPAQFVDRLYAFRLNKPLGIELAGESAPVIKHPKNKRSWYGTTLPWMSVGYSLQLTPLQILTFYNAVANNGTMVKPRFVTAIKDGGKTIQSFDTVVLEKRIASPQTIEAAHEMLKAVVEEGTGKKLKNKHYSIAGKTGTAKISENGHYVKGAYNATFVGYFPADNPQYSCIVVVNRPAKKGYYGAAAAAPVFKEIADKIYATSLAIEAGETASDTGKISIPVPGTVSGSKEILNIYKTLGVPVSEFLKEDDRWVSVRVTDKKVLIDAVEPQQTTVPDVRGMKAKDAVYLLENLGIETTLKGRGTVRWQSIAPGQPLTENQKITLQLSIL